MSNGVAVKSFTKEVESLLKSQSFIPEHMKPSLKNWVDDQLAKHMIGEGTSVTKGIEMLTEFQTGVGWLIAALKSRVAMAERPVSRPSVESRA